MPALIEILAAIEQRQLRVHIVETRKPSPFASSLLFSYVANFLYDGDAPLAERRAQALTIDQDQLRELLGEADLRELLDSDAIAEVEETAQCLPRITAHARADGIHDLCLRLGDLPGKNLRAASLTPPFCESVDRLVRARRLLELRIAGETPPRRRRRCRPLSRCTRHSSAAGSAGRAARAGRSPSPRTRPPLCPHPRPFHAARARRSLRSRSRRR